MNRIFIIPILFFLSFLIGVYFLLPKYIEFSDLKDGISKRERELHQKENYFFTLKELSAKLTQYREALNKIETALPEEPSLASLLSFFHSKSSESGLILKDLGGITSPPAGGEKKKKSNIQEIQISFTLQGSFPAFENFLKVLEKSSRLIEVKRITLKTKEKELPEFSFLVKIHSY